MPICNLHQAFLPHKFLPRKGCATLNHCAATWMTTELVLCRCLGCSGGGGGGASGHVCLSVLPRPELEERVNSKDRSRSKCKELKPRAESLKVTHFYFGKSFFKLTPTC